MDIVSYILARKYTDKRIADIDVGASTEESLRQIEAAKQQALSDITSEKDDSISDIGDAAESEIADIQSEGQKQQSAIAGSATQALESIGLTEQAVITQVNQAGSTQVGNVNNAGNAKIAEINEANSHSPQINQETGKWQTWDSETESYVDTEIDAQGPQGETGPQGEKGDTGLGLPTPTTEDKGKVPVVNAAGDGYELGNAQVDAYTKAESDARYAPIEAAIRPTVSGNPATLEHSVAWAMQGLSVYGKSTQVTTAGAQLLPPQLASAVMKDGVTFEPLADGRLRVYGTATKDAGVTGTTWVSLSAETYTLDIGIKMDSAAFRVCLTTYAGFPYLDIVDGNSSSTQTLAEPIQVTLLVRVYNGQTVDVVLSPMLCSGSTARPWEPYTGGKPSPSPDYPQEIVTAGSDGTIDISVSDGADQSQQLSISTPNGLPGIPVDSGGNFTDADGQHWVCDEVDLRKGVYVKRVNQLEFDGSENWYITGSHIALSILRYGAPVGVSGKSYGYSTIVKYMYNYPGNSVFIDGGLLYFGSAFSANYTLEEFKAKLAQLHEVGTPMKIMYQLDTPIETPLSDEELAAYAALRTYDGTTVVATDAPVAGLSARYVADGAAYIDSKIQSALAPVNRAILEVNTNV